MQPAHLQGGVAAHRQPDQMRGLDLQGVEHLDDIPNGPLPGVGRGIGRHLRRQIAAGGQRDAPELVLQALDLAGPAAVVAGVFVQEQHRRPVAVIGDVKAHPVGRFDEITGCHRSSFRTPVRSPHRGT